MSQQEREKVREIMELFARNPSNANKYYHQMLAIIEDGDYGLDDGES
jgi:hypothetical protein